MRRIIFIFFACCVIQPLFSQNAQLKKTFRISETYDIRQNIYPAGFTHFVTPLKHNHRFNICNTENQVFCYYDDHLDIYHKKQNYWQIYSISDGYIPLVRRGIDDDEYYKQYFEDFEDFFAFSLKGTMNQRNDTMKLVNIFDKKNNTLTAVNLQQFFKWKENLTQIHYTDPDFEWYIEKYKYGNVFRKNKKTGQLSTFSVTNIDYNDNSFLTSYKQLVIAAGPNQIKIFGNENIDAFQAESELYSNKISDVQIDKNLLTVIYDSVVDIVNAETNMLVRRFMPFTEVHKAVNYGDTLFYSINDSLFRYVNKNSQRKKLFQMTASITGLHFLGPNVIVETPIGLSCLDIRTDSLEHYFNNAILETEEDYGADEYGSSFSIAGEFNHNFMVLQKDYSYQDGSVHISLKSVDISKHKINDIHIPAGINDKMDLADLIKIENNYLFILRNDTLRLYLLSESEGLQFHEKLCVGLYHDRDSGDIPNAFVFQTDKAIGQKIRNAAFTGKELWISTDQGLFSYVLSNKKWKSHFQSSTSLHSGSGLIVTDEAIFSNNSSSYNIAGPWTRIDRKNYMIREYGEISSNPQYRSFRYNKKEIIYATPEGLVTLNPKTKETLLLSTPEPLGRVCFDGNRYLASGKNSLFRIDGTGKIEKLLDLIQPNIWINMDFPTLLESDYPYIWLKLPLEKGSLHTSLTLLNPVSGQTINYYFAFDDYLNALPDSAYTWIISTRSIYRYDKNKFIFKKIFSFPDANLSPQSAILREGKIIFTSTKGVFTLSTTSLSLNILDMHFDDMYSPSMIQTSDSMLYISSPTGIMQFHEAYFNKLLKKCFIGKEYKYDGNQILPFNYSDTIRINSNISGVELSFNLSREFRQHGINESPDYIPITASIGDINLKPGSSVGDNDYLNCIYRLTLDKKNFLPGISELTVNCSTDEGVNTLMKKWIILKKEE